MLFRDVNSVLCERLWLSLIIGRSHVFPASLVPIWNKSSLLLQTLIITKFDGHTDVV